MKNVIRLVVLVLGLATAYVAMAAPVTPAPDGGPPNNWTSLLGGSTPLCRPNHPCGY